MIRRRTLLCLGIVILGFTLAVFVGGCKKRRVVQQPPSRLPVPAAAPTITLTASPATIQRGESSTLNWSATNADTVTIEPQVGSVETSGSRSVSPQTSTTYIARATGAGGSRESEARITVTGPGTVSTTTQPSPTIDELLSAMDIFFDFDRYTIRSDAGTTLQRNAAAFRDLLNRNPDLKVTIEGHCDERGTAEYNMALGDRRATATKDFLASLGVSSDRLATVSYGQEGSPNYRPDPGHNEESWAKNRRSHFVRR